ncbi:hypothetical protein ABIE89_000082 [Bradyrhizobium niftali]
MVRGPSRRTIDSHNIPQARPKRSSSGEPAIGLLALKEQNGRIHSSIAPLPLCSKWMVNSNRVREQRWSMGGSGGAQGTPSHAPDRNLRCDNKVQRGSPTSSKLTFRLALLAARAASDTRAPVKAEPGSVSAGFDLSRSMRGVDFRAWPHPASGYLLSRTRTWVARRSTADNACLHPRLRIARQSSREP